ncbi:hypothetical protein HMN09_00201100 [Mycena chlorophos]|uniref:Uncharacterized protein n=1 Tax=Mycena chlorophos TaxID=658473 RepID=A0A8H6TSV2_MYCCL|nr:hypothetical protein HMN09_00201100 [Mycena chlorophos]
MQQFYPQQQYYPVPVPQYAAYASPVASPLYSPCLTSASDITQARERLYQRLKSHAGPSTFAHLKPFPDVHGPKTKRCEFNYALPCHCYGPSGCKHSGSKIPVRIAYEPPRRSDDYYHWTASLPDGRSTYNSSYANPPLAHVRVHSDIFAAGHPYGYFLEKDSRAILSALAASLELGMLVTITFDNSGVVFLGKPNDGGSSVILHRPHAY